MSKISDIKSGKYNYILPTLVSSIAVILLAASIGTALKPPLKVVDRFLPVNSHWDVSESIITNNFHAFKLYDCAAINSKWVPDAIANGVRIPRENIEFEFLDASDTEGTFPTGYIYVGGMAWRFKGIPTSAIGKIGLHGAHDCSKIGYSKSVQSTFWWGLPSIAGRYPMMEPQIEAIENSFNSN